MLRDVWCSDLLTVGGSRTKPSWLKKTKLDTPSDGDLEDVSHALVARSARAGRQDLSRTQELLVSKRAFQVGLRLKGIELFLAGVVYGHYDHPPEICFRLKPSTLGLC